MTKSLVIAIETDRNQAAHLQAIVRSRLGAELVIAESAARALADLGDRVPDLILTPALLSGRDEAALAGRLRDLGAAAAHVQTVTLPQIGGAVPDQSPRGVFDRFRRTRPAPAATEGCDPEIFAQQLSAYLQRAQVERAAANISAHDHLPAPVADYAALAGADRMPVPQGESAPTREPEPQVAVIDEYLAQPPNDDVAHIEPIVVTSEPVAVAAEPVAVVSQPAAAMPALEASPEVTEPSFLSEIAEPFAAPVVDEHVVDPTPLVESFIEAPVVVESFFAPALPVDEFIEPGPVAADMFEAAAVDRAWIDAEPVIDAFVALPPVVEDMLEPEQAVEEMIEPQRIVNETIAPEPIASPLAAAAATAPAFTVDDVELEFWIADEREVAPVEAAVVTPPQPVEDRVETATQDGGDIDMSSFLEGLVLPPVEPATPKTAETAARPVATAPAGPEPTPFPGPRRTQPNRPTPIHEHRVLEHKPARRKVKPPVQDEWGLFDPQQCGFAALVAKLDAVTEDEDAEKQRGTARLVSYN